MVGKFTSSRHCTCDFLTHFDLLRIIQNEKITSIDAVCETLMKCLSQEQLRRIIRLGIEMHFAQSKDCQLIKHIYNAFSDYHQAVNRNNKITTTNRKKKTKRHKYRNDTFAIRDLFCNIFSFLDYDTLRDCSKVNSNWLFGSYNPSSLYCFNTSMIHRKYQKFIKYGDLNLLRFKHCRKIVIEHSPDKQFPSVVDVFDNVREIDVNGLLKLVQYPHGDAISHTIQRIGMRIIKNNVNKIEKMRFIGCSSHHYNYGSGVYRYFRYWWCIFSSFSWIII